MSNVLNGGLIHARNRPMMVVTYYKKPAPGQNTSVKGWGEKGQWNVHEDMVITTRLKTKQEIAAHVVIDILQARVKRSRFDDATVDDVYKHFMEKYNNEVQRALGTWLQQNFSTAQAKAEITALTAKAEADTAQETVAVDAAA